MFHDEPNILHVGRRGEGPKLVPGMIFTVEPMINLGELDYEIWEDGWTVQNSDRKWTAQFEHTVLVTDSGYEILTKPDEVVEGQFLTGWTPGA